VPAFVDYVAKANETAVLNYVNNGAPQPNRYMFGPSFPTLLASSSTRASKLTSEAYPAASSSWAEMASSIPKAKAKKAKRVSSSTLNTVHGEGKSAKRDTALATESTCSGQEGTLKASTASGLGVSKDHGLNYSGAKDSPDLKASAKPRASKTDGPRHTVNRAGASQHGGSVATSGVESQSQTRKHGRVRDSVVTGTTSRGGKRSGWSTKLDTNRSTAGVDGNTPQSVDVGEPACKRKHEIVTATPYELLTDDTLLRGRLVGAIASHSDLEEVAKVQEATVSFEVSAKLQLKGSAVQLKAVVDTANRAAHPLINATWPRAAGLSLRRCNSRLVSADGQPLRVAGEATMEIMFESGYVWKGVVIAVLDLGDDLLLNASFASECVINGPQRSLQLPDGSVVSMTSKSIRTYDDERNVVCNVEPLTVTAGQAMLVSGKLSHSDYDGAELDMVGSIYGKCTIAGDVVDSRVFLSLFNSSDTDVEVPAGTVLSMVCSVRHSIAELASDSLAPPSKRQQQSEPTPMTTVVLKNKKGVEIEVQSASKHVEVLRPVLQKNVDVFAHDGDDLGLVEGYTLSIPTVVGQRPIVCRERPLNPRQMEVADEKVKEQLERGIIESSMSPWNAALLLARQPSQKSQYRFCIDYRRLNQATIPVNTALPNMNVIVRDLAGKKLYSTVDVKSAYNCLLIEPKDRDKTAFSHRGQKFRYVRAPFGLKSMPAIWQRVMTDVVGTDAQVFIDDCAMADNNIEEHAKRLDRVLSKLLKAGMKLSAKKCEFGTSMVKYLGYIVDARGINVDTGRYADFFDKPDPTTRKELKAGLAFFSVYRKFIKNFALRIACFKRFDKGDQATKSKSGKGSARTAVVFSDTDKQVWEDLKNDLKSRVSLAVPDFTRSFSIAVDASNEAWGAVLFQQPDRDPVMFASGQFNKSQYNYSATEKELAGLVNALDHFETFLIPGQEVVVYTDHKALQYLSTFKTKNSRLNRWSMALAEYDCKIVHVAGSKHADADYLSRPPFPSRYDQALAMTSHVPAARISAVGTSVKAQRNASHTDGTGEKWKRMADDFGAALRYMQCGGAASVAVVTRGSSKAHDRSARTEVLPPLVKLDKIVEAPRRVKVTNLVELAKETEHADATTLDMAKKLASAEAQVTPNYRVKLSQEIVRLQYQDPHLRNVASWLVDGVKAKGYSSWSKAYRNSLKNYRFGRRREPTQRGAGGERVKSLSARILREVVTTKKSAFRSRWVVAVPFALRDYMLYQYHDSAGAGHLGIHATLARLAGKFHWPGMYTDIVNHVKSCESCQQRKGSPSQHSIPKGQITASHFNHLVCVDVTHPGQQHSRQAKVVAIGKSYDTRPEHSSKAQRSTRGILTITDVWSRYTVLVAIHNEQADTFVDAFYNAWIKYFGAPRRLLSDNGSNFVAQSTKEQLASWGIVPENITPRNPQANGIAERINRPIMSALSALCGEGDDWHDYIPYVQLMLNTRVHSLLGVTPLEALCGHSTLFPEELESFGQEQSLDEHLRRLRTIRRGINKVYASKRRDLRRLRRSVKVPLTFEAGDKVMLYVKRKDQHKRSVRWDGPWTVSGLVNQPDDPNQFPLVYKICKLGQGGEVIATALGHINKLKLYHERV